MAERTYFTSFAGPVFLFVLFFFVFQPLSLAQDLIVIEKASRTLSFYRNGKLLRTYQVSLGWNPDLPKKTRGDGATPEGVYEIVAKRPSQKYGLFMALNYPNLKDVNLAWWEGRLSYDQYLTCVEAAKKKDPTPRCPLGFGLGIHGGGVWRPYEGKLVRDWTFGCVALDDRDLKELYHLAQVGTPVIIYHQEHSLFETLKQFVFPVQVPGIRLAPWWGEWEFELGEVLLRVSLWEDHRGLRRLILSGLAPDGRLLFYYRDENADGVISPWERIKAVTNPAWDYQALQEKILELLPLWVEKLDQKGRGG